MIELIEVKKTFQGFAALKGINLSLSLGEIVGLLGPNGAGKSTTISLLSAFEFADSGVINVCGFDPKKSPNEVRNLIGYVSENVSLYPYLSGIENLDYFCQLAGLKYTKKELETYLMRCGLSNEHHNKRASTYSKGMRQKVAIAIALAKNAKVYLLDEPASGLDPVASNELSEILNLLSKSGACILMASHDLFRVKQICNRILILNEGQIVKEFNGNDVSSQELERQYLSIMNN